MAKKIIWSRHAVADRIQIIDYWKRQLDSVSYASRLDNEFRKVIRFLSIYPKMGRRLESSDIRVLVKGHYQFFYLNKKEVIEILHIWDTRRNTDDLHFE